MPAKVDVVNVGLRKVGGNRITSMTDGTTNANIASDLYDEVLKDLLCFEWHFARNRVKLAQSSTTPTFEYDYAYVLPSDWVYTVKVSEDDGGSSSVDYKEEQVSGQNVILSNYSQLYLVYTYYETNPNLMPPYFRRALEDALAREFSIPIANSNKLHSDYIALSSRSLANAKSKNVNSSSPESRPLGSWHTARRGWRNIATSGGESF